MPGLVLPRHLSFCLVGGEAIFLDLRADRYFRLEGAAARAFAELRASPGGIGDKPSGRHLLDAGLLEPTAHPRPVEPAPDFIPIESLVESKAQRSRPRPAALLEIGLDLLRLRRALAHGRLHGMVEQLRRARGRREPKESSEERTGRLASHFLACRRLVPYAPNCLSDSLALCAYLARRGEYPGLVLGVKLDPFAAHCWVQTKARVLNDAAGNAADFKPVLVV